MSHHLSSNGCTNGSLLRSFKVASLAAQPELTPTGMKEELVLLSWLLVLSRTRERDQVHCQWAYRLQTHESEDNQPCQNLSLNEIAKASPSNIGETASAISRYLATVVQPENVADSTSLLLSTGSLKHPSQDLEDVSSRFLG